MPTKLVLQQRGASSLENKAEIPALENGKIDMSWLPVVGESGAAIIARGSNANGEWVRWEDGTQVCIFNSGMLGSDYAALSTCTFPAEFAEPPTVLPSMSVYTASSDSKNTNVFLYGAKERSVTTTSCQIGVLSIGAVALSSGKEKMFAIGRWK